MRDLSELRMALEGYCTSGIYPFHMPGHKRCLMPVPDLPYGWDVTEVPGTDDLHEAEGILKAAMDRTAAVFGAQKTWYLINGSTCGLLAGIRALAPRGSRVIAARNCHKAVFHAMELGDLRPRWLMPPMLPQGICGPVDPEDLKAALEDTKDAACVILTSPTYEGILTDIRACAELCHRYGVPLLVDEAHGAHLGLFPGWPESSVHLGADLIVQSVHKTLPSLTQTALLHLGTDSPVDPEAVERQLGIFETSSPSYPLMVSIDGCTGLIAREGEKLFKQWRQRLLHFDRRAADLQKLQILGHSQPLPFAFDPGKLPISTAGTTLRGPELAEILRTHYGLETEMAQGDICLAMTGPGDREEALNALLDALLEIDSLVPAADRPGAVTLPGPGEQALPMEEALLRPGQEKTPEPGQIAGEYVYAYPPGIPLVLPGEKITEECISVMENLEKSGTALHHSRCRQPGKLLVL